MSWCPRNGHSIIMAKTRHWHFAVARHNLSTNSPLSWTFPVRESVVAGCCPHKFPTLSPFAPLAVRERVARCPPEIPCTTNIVDASHSVIFGRMMMLDQSLTAREVAPAYCTARCAPSSSSSLRCGPPLTALAPPPAWLLRFHARAFRFGQRNWTASKIVSSRKMRMLCKHSQRQKPMDIPGNVRLCRTPEFGFSPWYFRPRDSKNHHHVEASLGGESREVNP